MFDSLTGSLQKIFKNLRGYGKLSEKNIQETMREVRLALLEADVHYQVAKDFIKRVKERCLGEEVLQSITPGQQVIKRVHDEMVHLLGDERKDFDLSGQPAMIMLLGLHGSGKTTTAGKLALRWKQEGRTPLLVAADIRRPAAVEQLRAIGRQIGVDVIEPKPKETVPDLGVRAVREARERGADVLLFDTGGRFQIDEELVRELKELRAAVSPKNVVLVLDAAIGQESVHVAETFNRELGLTGLILTKLDGDARGGAALSVQAVTGCPILLTGMGERPEDLEPFYPDRMASRILGMGDIVSVVEKAQATVNETDMARMEQKIRKNSLNLEDFLEQMQYMDKLGSMDRLLEMIPGGAQLDGEMRRRMALDSERETKRARAIILSMTPEERRHPDMINGSRRLRIAQGSGTDVRSVNELLKRFGQVKKMTRQMKKTQKRLRQFGR